jgi:hypothetical protein
MSLGPHIDARDRTVDAHNLYEWFYRYVPGYDGLRVPARFAMIVVLGLSALAALGLAAVARGRYAGGVVVLAGAAILAEGYAVPLRINADSPDYLQAGLAPLPGRILIGNRTPGVYRYVASSLPASAAIVELPFGEVAFDVRYQFYSTLHWRRLVNGYSGGAPREYGLLTEALKDLFTNPEPAWRALQETGATYAIVHETGYEGDRGHQVSEWLRAHGAKEIEYFYGDRLFALPRQD